MKSRQRGDSDSAKLTKASTSKSNRRKRKLTDFQLEPAPEHNPRETMKADQANKVTNASTLKSNRRKGKKSKFVSKPKRIWQVKNPTVNWLELPEDLTANILQRIGVFDILQNAEKVCTTWRKICKDPCMWRVISMDNQGELRDRALRRPLCIKICKLVADRSQGQLVDLSIHDFGRYELLRDISDRSSQLKRLQLIRCRGGMYTHWGVFLRKFPLLEEISTEYTCLCDKDFEDVGRYCPLLKTFKLNAVFPILADKEDDDDANELAIIIAKNLPNLSHLELIGNTMTNNGLQAILDGCTHLESLDIRHCFYLDLKKDEIGKRCLERIKHVKLPNDSLEEGGICIFYVGDYHYDKLMEPSSDVSCESGISFDDSEYDDYYYDYGSDDGSINTYDPQECNDYVNLYYSR
ncbi:F-box protein SKIP19-like [Rutidosis leptorrhynchoides]|uniref:F-box protein SKIP19-like n=1 Tax=Rutidosis leptorrhynchoides TaxID=125765 RepID=UPI003A998712